MSGIEVSKSKKIERLKSKERQKELSISLYLVQLLLVILRNAPLGILAVELDGC